MSNVYACFCEGDDDTLPPHRRCEPCRLRAEADLAKRACLLVRVMLTGAARHLCKTDLAELNAVMLEAERRGWYREDA